MDGQLSHVEYLPDAIGQEQKRRNNSVPRWASPRRTVPVRASSPRNDSVNSAFRFATVCSPNASSAAKTGRVEGLEVREGYRFRVKTPARPSSFVPHGRCAFAYGGFGLDVTYRMGVSDPKFNVKRLIRRTSWRNV